MHQDLPTMLIIVLISAAIFLFTRWRAIKEGEENEQNEYNM